MYAIKFNRAYSGGPVVESSFDHTKLSSGIYLADYLRNVMQSDYCLLYMVKDKNKKAFQVTAGRSWGLKKRLIRVVYR